MHVREGRNIRCIIPAGGLVTALDPVMRICDGTWIANGSGDGDREVVDENNKTTLPSEDPAYTLKRIWLTKEEEMGIITVFPTKDSGRYAISPTPVLFSA